MDKPAVPMEGDPVVPQLEKSESSVSHILIFHPGSRHLRLGRASDPEPVTILHAVARRRRNTKGPADAINLIYKDTLFPLGSRKDDGKLPAEVESARLQSLVTLQTSLKSDGSPRFATPTQTIANYNKTSKKEVLDLSNLQKAWEDFQNQDVVVGFDILKMDPDANFNIHCPWRRGQLNLHRGIGGSLSSVMTDLGDIWRWGVTEKLGIDLKDLKDYKAIVIIPAMFDRVHAKDIMNLVLNEMGFESAFLLQDHVCATFGSGLANATVVDVGQSESVCFYGGGDQKISVSCVEDGVSYPQSRIELKYGGGDLSLALWNLMCQAAVPFHINLTSVWDLHFLNELKETLCHFDLNRCGPEEHAVLLNKPGQPPVKYNIFLGDELLIVPLSYFNPDLLRGSITSKAVVVHGRPQPTVADDPFDTMYINETSRRGLKEVEGEGEEEDIEDSKDESSSQPAKIDTDKLLGIEQAILQSIDSCNVGEELKRRLYSSILIVGGGFKFERLGSWLQNKISINTPRIFKTDYLEVITQPKEGDPAVTTWKGASILVSLETAAELWITKPEWNSCGSKILREKSLCCF